MMNEYAKYKAACQDMQVKLQAVREIIQEQYATRQVVEKKLEEALVDFNNKGVQVYYKDGFVKKPNTSQKLTLMKS
jgi:chemotaxis protein MotB